MEEVPSRPPAAALRHKIDEAVRVIGTEFCPEFAIILGTGLGPLAEGIRAESRIPYDRLPHFARPTVPGHKGELILGTIEGRRIAALEGRFHYYEGYTLEQITFPVRVMRALGARVLMVSNAAGGLNPAFSRGDLMLIEDHINLMGVNPLIGPNDDTLGPRFPDLCRVYDPDLLRTAEEAAATLGLTLRRGVYAALTGPNLETRAEYRFLRTIGADAVGMSTVPEVLVGIHAGFRILGISIITDLCFPDTLEPVNIEEILRTARQSEPHLSGLLRGFLRRAKP